MIPLDEWLEAKERRKKKIAQGKYSGISNMSESMAEMKADMAQDDGFHNVCRERDRTCQPCQNFYERIRKAGKHADHIIIQAHCSREERLDPTYGMGCCAECNDLRNKHIHGAAMLEDSGLMYQVMWNNDSGICKRRLMGLVPGSWYHYTKPEWMKDSRKYQQ